MLACLAIWLTFEPNVPSAARTRATGSLEQQLCKLVQVRTPQTPFVAARRRLERVLDAVPRQRVIERFRAVQRTIFVAGCQPDQLHLLGRGGSIAEELRVQLLDVLTRPTAEDETYETGPAG